MDGDIMFDQRSSVRGRWWRAGVAGVTVPLMVLLAALAGATAQAEPVDMANQQYAKTTRDGWHLTLSIDNERVNSVPNLAAALNSREGFVTLSATATATGGSAPITDSLFIAGYPLGCQSDVSSGLGIGGIASANASVGVPSGVNDRRRIDRLYPDGHPAGGHHRTSPGQHGVKRRPRDARHRQHPHQSRRLRRRRHHPVIRLSADIDRRRAFLVRHLRRPRQDLA